VTVASAASALTVSGVAPGAQRQPSERSCLLEWNSPANSASRERVVASGLWSAASLRPGTILTIPGPAQGKSGCILHLRRKGRFLAVNGPWRNGRVAKWSFGPSGRISGDQHIPSNVRVLPDGRVTKIYRP
jgi:hypothetical protein